MDEISFDLGRHRSRGTLKSFSSKKVRLKSGRLPMLDSNSKRLGLVGSLD